MTAEVILDRTSSELFVEPSFLKTFSFSSLRKASIFPLYSSHKEEGFAVLRKPLHHPFNKTKPISYFLVTKHQMDRLFADHFPSYAQDLLTCVLEYAVEHNASDIHISQKETSLAFHIRTKGKLIPLFSIFTPNVQTTFLRLLKLNAHMTIAALHRPQDGRFDKEILGESLNCRVACLPTLFGEDIVIRLFSASTPIRTVQECGFSENTLTQITKALTSPSGLICVTGPTGSGKTTTLYAMISFLLNQSGKQIITIEDPVERILPHIRQSQINLKTTYTYERALKAILRQDPDVIVIGEIRDAETAKIALDAAYTGHLVLTSLHTSDVHASILRLLNFDLDPFLITHCLRGIFSQRLTPHQDEDRLKLETESFIPPPSYTQLSISSVQTFINQGTLISF